MLSNLSPKFRRVTRLNLKLPLLKRLAVNAKFQAEMKELDEKFAAISEDDKRQYDRHRFIRRAIMTYWSSTFIVFYLFAMLVPYLKSFFVNNGIELPPEVFSYIRGAVMIVAPIFWTFYVLRRNDTAIFS